MFNLQSGILRQRFPPAVTPGQAKRLKTIRGNAGTGQGPKRYSLGEGRHTKAISGLMVDSLNRVVISCGLDGRLKFWDFSTGLLEHEMDWHSFTAITGFQHYRSSDLIALSCDDLAIRVVDTETKNLVRELWGSLGQVSDFCFSNDGRWIIAASMDSVIRVWDLPTGHLINAVRMQSQCTALAFSETGEYLATAHADGVGINIWNNRTLFTHIPTRVIREGEIMDAVAPTTSGEGGQHLISAAFSDSEDEGDERGEEIDGLQYASLDHPMEQLSSDLITLSLVPKSRWQTLVHLDTIAQRNKPKEPPKRPEKAPFFLASSLSLGADPASSIFQPQDTASEPSAPLAEQSRISKLRSMTGASTNPFTTLLHSSSETGLYEPFITHLSSLSPAAADIEIRSLSPMLATDDSSFMTPSPSHQNQSELSLFIRALTARLRQKRDYELVNAWMTVFLKVHGESVVEDPSLSGGLREALAEWRSVQQEEARRLGEMLGFCKGVVGWLRSER
jgi:U3 small nucleolar RNA-associated protein 21